MIMDHMANIYAILIIDGEKKFNTVPNELKDKVKEILISKGVNEALYTE